MKTRIIQTSFWRDSLVNPMNIDTKLVYLYLLTNEHAGLTDYQKIIIQEVSLYTGLDRKLVEYCLEQLQEKKLMNKSDDWVKMTGGAFVNSNYKGGNVDSAKEKELSEIPYNIREILDIEVPHQVPAQVPINHKSEIINNKPKIINNNSEIETPEFIKKETWADWLQYRKERKKPLTSITIKKQIEFLALHQKDANEIINQSIKNSWEGLFPLKRETKTNMPENQTGEKIRNKYAD